MSYDQRPGKLRVVHNGSAAPAANGQGEKTAIARPGAASPAIAGRASPARASAEGYRLPMLQAGIFLFACLVGGIVFAIARPF